MTPMMEQYFEVKNNYKDCLLFYRLGDFYEMFFDDAIVASRELELTLTGRDCGEAERAPMCGVPFHSVDTYIGKLIEKGYKIAICEQMEDPSLAKGLVKRDVTRIISKGTLIESNLLTDKKNNFLSAIYVGEYDIGVCFCDISTAEVFATSFSGNDAESALVNELAAYSPVEIVVNLAKSKTPALADFALGRLGAAFIDNQPTRFEYEESLGLAKKHFFETAKENDFDDRAVVCAVGGLLNYIYETQKKDISYINKLTVYTGGAYMQMDANTRRNLELCESMRSKEKKGTLLWVLDKTKSAMGVPPLAGQRQKSKKSCRAAGQYIIKHGRSAPICLHS